MRGEIIENLDKALLGNGFNKSFDDTYVDYFGDNGYIITVGTKALTLTGKTYTVHIMLDNIEYFSVDTEECYLDIGTHGGYENEFKFKE